MREGVEIMTKRFKERDDMNGGLQTETAARAKAERLANRIERKR